MNYKPISKLSSRLLLSIVLIALPLLLFGCSNGDDGAPGTSSGTLTGSVIDIFNNKVANVTVTPSPAVDSLPGGRVTTAADGAYSMTLPTGNYTLTFANAAYVTQTLAVSVVAAQTKANAAIILVPKAAAAVTVTGPSTFPATGSVTLTAALVPLDPGIVGKPVTFQWKDERGNVLGTSASVTVNRPTTAEFKANVAQMVAPLESIEPNPANLPDEEGEEGDHFKDIRRFKTLDRLMVVGIPMKAYEDAANPKYTVTATAAGLPFSQTVAVGAGTTGLPFVANPGLRNVPIGQPLMLQGPDSGETQTTWNFTLTKPSGSAASLDLIDKTTRFPHFTPDVVGTYTVTETVSAKSMKIYAGKWIGILQPAVDGSDNPRGDLDPGCLSGGGGLCHSAATLTKFTDWRKSGHSEVMVVGMAEGSHYNVNSCANCHSVGGTYLGADTSAGSFRNVIAASGFTNATFLSQLVPSLDEEVIEKSPFFKGFPQVLQLSEVQCENCHGPNSNGEVHGAGRPDPANAKAARVSFSSDVCAPCHGEPTRHGRYQEWRESGHGDFETAIGEGFSGTPPTIRADCAGCHTGQGFVPFVAQLQGGNPLRTLTPASIALLNAAGVTRDTVQPITCVTCHTPHDAGKQPGLVGNVVKLRGDYQSGGAWDGNTPLLPSGFQANGVGRGALCITCHNSRNGGSGTTVALHEDGNPIFGNFTSYSAPHEAAQGDVLMGRNAYFFGTGQIGQRSKHSLLADACVTCHLQKTPADPAFGVGLTTSGAGTNHSFGIITSPTLTVEEQVNALCKQCHGDFEGTGVQKTFETAYNNMIKEVQNAILRVKFGSTGAIPPGTTLVFIPGRSPAVSVNGAANQTLASYLANAPGTPATGPIPASGFQIDLGKANWNATLVEVDQSKGVHNPGFSLDVIQATQNRMKAL